MPNCSNCNENSSTTYSRCQPAISSNCVFYQGQALECTDTFKICKGDNLTDVQITIFNKLCEVLGDIDVSHIEIPSCLTQAWDSSDLNIFNLFTLLLQEHCTLQTEIDNINTSLTDLNPQVSVCLSCCEESGCVSSAKIYLSEALNKIVACICGLKATVGQLESDLGNLKSSYNTLVTQVGVLQSSVDLLVIEQPKILKRLACIETRINNTPEVPASC